MKKVMVGLLGVVCSLAYNPEAFAATSNWTGPGSDFSTAGNWDAGIPVDDAGFNAALPTAISLSANRTVNSFTYNPGATRYTLTLLSPAQLAFAGAGIVNNSGTDQIFVNNGGSILFSNSASAGSATIINTAGTLQFSQSASGGSATISNSGTLSFTGSSTGGSAFIVNNVGASIQVIGATLGNANITNNGTLDASNAAAAWSAGSIAGSGNLLLGSTTLTVGSNSGDTTITGAISGQGASLVKVGNGMLTLAGANSYTGATTVNVGTLILQSSTLNDVTVAAGANFWGTGTVGNLINGGQVAPGGTGIGTLVASSYSGPGTLMVGFNGSSHSELNVTGNVDITGETLNVIGSTFAVGRYSALSAGTLTGTFSRFFQPTSSLLTFATSYSPTDVFVQINFATTFLPFAQNTNQQSVAANLNEPKITSSLEFTNAVSSMAVLPASQIPAALTQLSGDALASFQPVALHNAAVFTQGMRERAVSVSSSSYGLWAQGMGWVDSMKGDSGIGSPASHAGTSGVQAGYDMLGADDVLFGFCAGYAQTNLDVTDRASSGDTQSLQSGMYAAYTRGPWFTNGGFAYTAESNNMTRTIQFGGINEQAKAVFDSRVESTFLEGGYRYRWSKSFSIEPSIAIRQSHLRQDAFTETGAPGLGLTVADESVDSVVSDFVLGVQRIFFQDSTHPLFLNGRAGWQHELLDTHDVISAHFAETSGGSNFTVEGTPRSRKAAILGLEGHIPLRSNVESFVSYTATLASAETNQKIFGGARFRW